MSTKSEALAGLYAALGDPARLHLVERLADGGEHPLKDLAEGLPMSRQAVAKHLRQLEAAGLASATRQGRESRWRVVPGGLKRAEDHLAELGAQWDAALARLANFVDGED